MFTLKPIARRLLGAAALVAGVFVVGGELRGSAPREVRARLSLREFERAGAHVRAVTVRFERGDEPVRVIERRFTVAPREFVETLTLPEGVLRAHVTVLLDDRALERVSNVTIAPGATLELSAPSPP